MLYNLNRWYDQVLNPKKAGTHTTLKLLYLEKSPQWSTLKNLDFFYNIV